MFDALVAAQKGYEQQGRLGPFWVAETLAMMGRNEEAIPYLEKSWSEHDERTLDLVDDPLLASLHGDPRYEALCRRLVPGPRRQP